jgi:putative ABC transport system substrate-binding protein
MDRRVMLGLLAMATLWTGAASAQSTAPEPGRTYKVGYSQIIDHPALNATRAGFLEGLKDAGFIEGKNLTFEYLNAQGDVANARNIAEKFLADKVDLMAPCTTPNVQAAIKVTHGTTVPVAFGCVTNPVESGILTELGKPTGTNVTGIYGIPPVGKMFDLILKLVPNVKMIGTVYNPSEANSVTLNTLNKAEARKRGVAWAEIQITSTGEVLGASQALATKAEVFLMPQDNTIASSFDAVVHATRERKIPLFSYDTTAVERGAIGAFAQDQHQAGVDWAKEVAVPVLLGKPAGSVVPATYTKFDLLLNREAAKAAGIELPADLVSQAVKVWN